MSKAAEILSQAKQMVASRSTPELVLLFEHANGQPVTEDVAQVRGWILDELEVREALDQVGLCGGCWSEIEQCECREENG